MSDEHLERCVEEVLAKGPAYVTAFDQLTEAGAAAIPVIVAAIARGRAAFRLTAVLEAVRLDDPGVLEEYLASDQQAVISAVIGALGASGDTRALPILERALGRGRRAAIDALGDLGQAEGIPIIKAQVAPLLAQSPPPIETWINDRRRHGDLQLLGEAARSLAKLGDQSMVSIACDLLTTLPQDTTSAGEVRAVAIDALEVMASPGIAVALRAACTDDDDEVAERAIAALGTIGRLEEAEILVRLAADQERSAAARQALRLWSGEPITDDVAGWWRRGRSRFQPGVCYLGGRPATPATLIEQLVGAPRPDARAELLLRTGARCVHEQLADAPVTPRERAAIEAWWAAHQHELPAGQLHRWGRSYPPGAVD